MGRKRKAFSLFIKRGIYYASFYDGEDNRIRVSLETESETEAKERAKNLAKEYANKTYHAKDEAKSETLNWAFELYLMHRKVGNGLSAATEQKYSYDLGHLLRVFGRDFPLSELSKTKVYEYCAQRDSEGASAYTVEQECRMLVRVLRHLSDLEMYSGSLNLVPSSIKGSYSPKERMLSPKEVQLVLKATEKLYPEKLPHILAWLTLGLRKADLFSITHDCVDFDQRTLKAFNKKRKQWMVLPIHDRLYPVLEALYESRPMGESLFPPMTRDQRHATRRIAKEAGIPYFTIHDLRRSCGSLLASNGVPLRTIADILGHSNISTTFRTYSHLLTEAKSDAINKLPI